MNVLISKVIRELSKEGFAFMHYQAPQLRGFDCLLSGVPSLVMQLLGSYELGFSKKLAPETGSYLK